MKTETDITVDHQEEMRATSGRVDTPWMFMGQTKGDWYMYWICAVASIANIFGGFDAGIYSVILSDENYINKFDAVGARSGVIASMATVGCILGNWFVSWWFTWFLGRRLSFAFAPLIIIVGVAMQAGAQSFGVIVTGRVIAGIGSVITGTNQAAYQAEVSSAAVRGRVVSLVQLSFQVGVLIAYCAGLGTVKIAGDNSWRTATALQIIPGVILMAVAFTLPESPRWMIERHPDQPERALQVLAKIRCLPTTHPDVEGEFTDLVAANQYRIQHEGEITWKKFFGSYAVWKRIAFGMATMALGQISGVGALMIYGVLIYESLGFSGTTQSLLLNVVSGILCLLATAVTMAGVDRWGRRPTLMVGCAVMVISYAIIGGLADGFPTETKFNRIAAGFQVAFIYVIQMAYSGALGPCAWIYACEIFPTHIRDKGVNISQSGQMLTGLWLNQAWPTMFGKVGHNAYWILMGINLVGFTVVLLFWPETKGIGLEHMGKVFGEIDDVEAWRVEKQSGVPDTRNLAHSNGDDTA